MARYDIQIALQTAALAAIADARTWRPGEIAFQGGSALNFVYQSPRRSEDLDFLVDEKVDLAAVAAAVHENLAKTLEFPGLAMRFRDKPSLPVDSDDPVARPRVFTLAAPQTHHVAAILVKLDFWPAPAPAIADITTTRREGVSTETLREIFVDKVYALGARPYFKPRDVFDLAWISERLDQVEIRAEDLRRRLTLYPNQRAETWLEQAAARNADLDRTMEIQDDLARWLPDEPSVDTVARWAEAARDALQRGTVAIHELKAHMQNDATVEDRNEGRSPVP